MSEYEPMWSDPTEIPTTEPLTSVEVAALRAPTLPGFNRDLFGGDTVRVVDRTGRVAQGAITKTRGHRVHAPTEFTVGGKTWCSEWSTFYRAPAGAPEFAPAPIKLTGEAFRDLAADLSGTLNSRGQATAVTMDAIMRRVLGYDPSIGKPGSEYGGKSKSGWINEHFSLSTAKKIAAELCDAGVLQPATASRSTTREPVTFSYGCKSGWVLTSMFEAAQVAISEQQDTAQTAKLLAQARQNIADRHLDEVRAELLLLRAADRA